jgi:hypothetical protein
VVWETAFPCRQRAGVVLADGRLIAYTDTGRLVVLDASFEAFRERARIEVAGRNWVPPVLAQGCLFLRDHKGLRCLRLPAAAP